MFCIYVLFMSWTPASLQNDLQRKVENRIIHPYFWTLNTQTLVWDQLPLKHIMNFDLTVKSCENPKRRPIMSI